MELTVLGASGSWPTAGDATSGYLVTHDGFHLWIDLGSGTLARVQMQVPHTSIDAIVISHAHPDHYVDLHLLFYARFFFPESLPTLPVFMPPGAFERITAGLGKRAAGMLESFDVQELEPGASLEIGPFRLQTRPMNHSVPTLGMRLEGDRRTIAYTADTAPTDEIVEIARGTDLMLSEATYLVGDHRAPLHLTARQAGAFAARAEVERLALTHLWPTVDPRTARLHAAESFGGDVEIATQGFRVDLGSAKR